MTPTAASRQTEKRTWPLGPLPTVRPAFHPWSFVERSKSIISLGGQDKPGVTHIYGRLSEDDVPMYDTAVMASELPGLEQKLKTMITKLRSW